MGKRQGAAQLLLGVANIDTEPDVQLDRLVEAALAVSLSRATASAGG